MYSSGDCFSTHPGRFIFWLIRGSNPRIADHFGDRQLSLGHYHTWPTGTLFDPTPLHVPRFKVSASPFSELCLPWSMPLPLGPCVVNVTKAGMSTSCIVLLSLQTKWPFRVTVDARMSFCCGLIKFLHNKSLPIDHAPIRGSLSKPNGTVKVPSQRTKMIIRQNKVEHCRKEIQTTFLLTFFWLHRTWQGSESLYFRPTGS